MTDSETVIPPGMAGDPAEDTDGHDATLAEAVRALIEDGQTLVEAEVAYRKAQAAYGIGQARTIAVLLVLGLTFGFFALLAAVVGLLLALASTMGTWSALAVVGGALFFLCVLCLLLAARRVSKAKRALTGQDANA